MTALTGCGPAGLSHGDACARYVAHVNGLGCTWLDLPDARLCPVGLPPSPCDLDAWYDCLAANTTCTDGVLDGSAAATCAFIC